MDTGTKVVLGVIGAVAVAGVLYLAMTPRAPGYGASEANRLNAAGLGADAEAAGARQERMAVFHMIESLAGNATSIANSYAGSSSPNQTNQKGVYVPASEYGYPG